MRHRRYEYQHGFNYRALGALAAGIAVALTGLIYPPLEFLYKYAWFVGFLMAGAVYYALMQSVPVSARAVVGEEA